MEAVAVLKERYSPYNAHFAIKMDLLRVKNTMEWDA